MKNLPTKCPSCNSVLKWTSTKTDLVCPNRNCTASTSDKVKVFFVSLGVDSLKGGTVDQLVEAGYDSVLKIVRAKPEDLMTLEGFGKAKSEKIVNSIRNTLHSVTWSQLMHASGCFTSEMSSLGTTRLDQILGELGQEKAFDLSATQIRSKLAGVSGIGPVILDLFTFGLPKFLEFYNKISKYVKIMEPEEPESDSLEGYNFCFTEFRDSEMEASITKNGGRVMSSVNKNTTVLFYGKTTSTKFKRAQDLNVKSISKEKAWSWLKKKLNQ